MERVTVKLDNIMQAYHDYADLLKVDLEAIRLIAGDGDGYSIEIPSDFTVKSSPNNNLSIIGKKSSIANFRI